LVEGRVNGVTRAGLFISIAAYGAEGFLPISLLPRGYWRFDAARQCLTQGSGTGASSLGLGDTMLAALLPALRALHASQGSRWGTLREQLHGNLCLLSFLCRTRT
jgi:ribonuclease R